MKDETLHLRQVHPTFIKENGLPSSQTFSPFPKDKGELSVYDGDQINAVDSYTHYIEVVKKKSVGVWAVTGKEVISLELSSMCKPLENFEAHAVIDFNPRTEKESRKVAKELLKKALERGCLHDAKDK